MRSSEITVSAQVGPLGPRVLYGVTLTPAAAASTLTIFDNSSGTGVVLMKITAAANGSSTVVTNIAVPASVGLFAVIAGASAAAYVQWG